MATSSSVPQLLNEFRNKTTPGVYKHFTNRTLIANQIQQRVNAPYLIDQGGSSLCGPASLLYCLAKKSPQKYAKFIIDLYNTGKGNLSGFKVKPGSDNKSYNLPTASKMVAVDWIGLSSIRDSENDFFDYESYKDKVAGITMPGDLLSWFSSAGFTQGINDTNLVDDENLSTLLSAHAKHQAGYQVCLFVGAEVLWGGKSGRGTADHWVVLNSPIRIDNKPVQPLLAKGTSVDGDKTLLSKKLDFNIYTWGNDTRPVNKGLMNLTVEHFLNYFYGYIACK